MKKGILLSTFMLMFSALTFAQTAKDTVVVDGYYETGGTYGTLNDAISAAVTAGTINNTVFKLKPYEVYVLNRSIFMDLDQNLEIVADKPGTDQESAPPQIVWTEEDIDNTYIIQTYGDLVMKNIWVRYADILGNKIANTGIVFENQPDDDQEVGYFDGVLFDYAGIGPEAGGSVTVKADHFHGTFKNSYFRNNNDIHFRYYGRAVSFPFQSTGWKYDYLLFENTTFANISRIVMMEGNEYGDNIHLNHVTILNTLEEVVQSGWLNKFSITNSVIVNPYMLGYYAVDVCEDDQSFRDFERGECGDAPSSVFSLMPVDSFGFEVDFTDLDRQVFVGNNAIYTHDWLLDWMVNCDPVCLERTRNREQDLLPQPRAWVSDGVIAFMDSTTSEGAKYFTTMNIDSASMIFGEDPQFIVEATNQDTLKDFVERKWRDNSDIDWAYKPEAGFNQIWPLPENMAYEHTGMQTAAMGGFPLGDLNWYPEQMAAWEAQYDTEWETITNWLETGNAMGTSIDILPAYPDGFNLEQNYPNPFNPNTSIGYSIPKTSEVSIKVYNSLGQLVSTLFEGTRVAGSHTINFNAQGLSSGVYYYVLEAPSSGVMLTRKLTLIK